MARIDELILYRDFEKGELLRGMNWIMEHYKDCQYRGEVRERFFGCMHELVDLAGNYGFENNIIINIERKHWKWKKRNQTKLLTKMERNLKQ